MISAVKKIRAQSCDGVTRAGYFRVGIISWAVGRIKYINIRNVFGPEPAREPSLSK